MAFSVAKITAKTVQFRQVHNCTFKIFSAASYSNTKVNRFPQAGNIPETARINSRKVYKLNATVSGKLKAEILLSIFPLQGTG